MLNFSRVILRGCLPTLNRGVVDFPVVAVRSRCRSSAGLRRNSEGERICSLFRVFVAVGADCRWWRAVSIGKLKKKKKGITGQQFGGNRVKCSRDQHAVKGPRMCDFGGAEI